MDEARCGVTSQLVNGCAAHASRRLLTRHLKTCLLVTLFTSRERHLVRCWLHFPCFSSTLRGTVVGCSLANQHDIPDTLQIAARENVDRMVKLHARKGLGTESRVAHARRRVSWPPSVMLGAG